MAISGTAFILSATLIFQNPLLPFVQKEIKTLAVYASKDECIVDLSKTISKESGLIYRLKDIKKGEAAPGGLCGEGPVEFGR